MGGEARAVAEPGTQQNWEICDLAGLNMIVLYAESASVALGRAAQLLALPANRLRAKALASHLAASESDHFSASAWTWDSPDLI